MIHKPSYVAPGSRVKHPVGVHGHVVVVLLLLPLERGLDPPPELVHGDQLADVLDEKVSLLDIRQHKEAEASCGCPHYF